MSAALEIAALRVEFRSGRDAIEVLHGVSLDIAQGEIHGVVGETGSGKSTTALAALGLLPRGGHVTAGSIRFDGSELVGASEPELRAIRGSQIAMILQNPRTALYPLTSVERQMLAVLGARGRSQRRAGHARVLEYLALAGVSDPERVGRAYPHELSGGLAQRVVIATSLIREPQVLIADEPTTGLDVTIQLQVLQLLDDLRRRLNLAVLMITHDLGIVTNFCDRVTVMQDGDVVERGSTREVLGSPRESYTVALMEASRLRPADGTRPVAGSSPR